MKPKILLDQVVGRIKQSGAIDPSSYHPYESLWDAIKVNIQQHLDDSQTQYRLVIFDAVSRAVTSLSSSELDNLRLELKANEDSELYKSIFTKLISRGRKEKIRFAPVNFYFYYFVDDLTIYGQAVERTSLETVMVNAFSELARHGETGEMYFHRIAGTITQELFSTAREMGWPDIKRLPI